MHTIGPCAGSVSAQTLVRKLASQACPPVHSLSLLHHQTHLTQSLITEPRWLALGLAPYGTPGTKALLCPPVAAGFGGLRLKKDKKKEQCPCGSGQSLEVSPCKLVGSKFVFEQLPEVLKDRAMALCAPHCTTGLLSTIPRQQQRGFPHPAPNGRGVTEGKVHSL